jgi:hypothetical protein
MKLSHNNRNVYALILVKTALEINLIALLVILKAIYKETLVYVNKTVQHMHKIVVTVQIALLVNFYTKIPAYNVNILAKVVKIAMIFACLVLMTHIYFKINVF